MCVSKIRRNQKRKYEINSLCVWTLSSYVYECVCFMDNFGIALLYSIVQLRELSTTNGYYSKLDL